MVEIHVVKLNPNLSVVAHTGQTSRLAAILGHLVLVNLPIRRGTGSNPCLSKFSISEMGYDRSPLLGVGYMVSEEPVKNRDDPVLKSLNDSPAATETGPGLGV